MRPVRITHPIVMAAVATLVLNDQWLKYAHPSWLTGKLSDVAGLTFFPVLVAAFLERALPKESGGRALALAGAVTAAVFAVVKTTHFGTELYREGLGALQWPWHAARALLEGRPTPHLRKVFAVTDPTDTLAVPFAGVGWALSHSSARTRMNLLQSVLSVISR